LEQEGDGAAVEASEDEPEELIVFAIYLHDPMHSIAYSAISQAVPAKWLEWLEAAGGDDETSLPDAIAEIIETGGVDPREWVAEWIDEVLSLVIGVVAQRYVAKRMGVGVGACVF